MIQDAMVVWKEEIWQVITKDANFVNTHAELVKQEMQLLVFHVHHLINLMLPMNVLNVLKNV